MSWQMKVVSLLMRATRKRGFATEERGHALLAAPKNPSAPPGSLSKTLTVTTSQVRGFDIHRVRRSELAENAPVVVYLHGGAYVNEIVSQHWSLIRQVAESIQAEVWVPIYGLAPQHTGLEALAFVSAVLDELAAQGRAVEVVGDSAGGGLALIAAQDRIDRDPGTVRGVTVMAPWLDLSISNPEVDALEPHDPWLARPALRTVAASWADVLDLRDPRVSPLFGRFAGLPPVDIWVGDRDITLPDSRLLRASLDAAGVEVFFREEPGAIHVYPLLPVPEGKAARGQMIERIAARLSPHQS